MRIEAVGLEGEKVWGPGDPTGTICGGDPSIGMLFLSRQMTAVFSLPPGRPLPSDASLALPSWRVPQWEELTLPAFYMFPWRLVIRPPLLWLLRVPIHGHSGMPGPHILISPVLHGSPVKVSGPLPGTGNQKETS